MTLIINAEELLKDLPKKLNTFKNKSLTSALQRTVNDTIRKARTVSNDRIREFRKIKKGEFNKDFLKMKLSKASKNLEKISSELTIIDRKVTLIRFLVGKKSAPRPNLKGVKIKKRRRIQIQIEPGKKTILRKSFVAIGKGGSPQIFFRGKNKKGNKALKIRKTHSPAILFRREKFRAPVDKVIQDEFEKNYHKQIKLELERLS